MTVAAKKVIAAYYGQHQKASYFSGCSTGGHQGLTEAQRYPDDYNGILAGAAGNNRTHLHLAFLHYFRTMKAAPIPAATMTAVHKKILAACVGKDGGVASDEFLNNPAACKFKLFCAKPGKAANASPSRNLELSRRSTTVRAIPGTGTSSIPVWRLVPRSTSRCSAHNWQPRKRRRTLSTGR
jgi:hypothetical protein